MIKNIDDKKKIASSRQQILLTIIKIKLNDYNLSMDASTITMINKLMKKSLIKIIIKTELKIMKILKTNNYQ